MGLENRLSKPPGWVISYRSDVPGSARIRVLNRLYVVWDTGDGADRQPRNPAGGGLSESRAGVYWPSRLVGCAIGAVAQFQRCGLEGGLDPGGRRRGVRDLRPAAADGAGDLPGSVVVAVRGRAGFPFLPVGH